MDGTAWDWQQNFGELSRHFHVYALDRHKGLKCIELKTGQIKWEDRHVTAPGRNPQASLIWVDRRALILNAQGELILADLTPKAYREIDKSTVLAKGTWAHPAFAGKCVFARNDQEIVCVPLAPE